jgi:hypothetical protein
MNQLPRREWSCFEGQADVKRMVRSSPHWPGDVPRAGRTTLLLAVASRSSSPRRQLVKLHQESSHLSEARLLILSL